MRYRNCHNHKTHYYGLCEIHQLIYKQFTYEFPLKPDLTLISGLYQDEYIAMIRSMLNIRLLKDEYDKFEIMYKESRTLETLIKFIPIIKDLE